MKNLPQNNDIYQVYFLISPAHKPLHFAIHPWVVTVKNDVITRWEVLHKKRKEIEKIGYIHKNLFQNPTQGLEKSIFGSASWDSTLIGSISGNEKSVAKQVVDFIEEMTPFYPHQENYVLFPGPNSNTYIGWILRKFPELKIELPSNAFGKNFK